MNREKFMEQLEQLLMDIPVEEREEALAYYSSYFEDAGPENEARIIRELESPEKVAAIIRTDVAGTEQNTYQQAGTAQNSSSQKESSKMDPSVKKALIIFAVVITCPIWLTFLGTLVALVLSAAAVVVSLAVSFVLVVASFYISGLVFVVRGIMLMAVGGQLAAGLGVLGLSLILLTLALLGTILCVSLFGAWIPKLVRVTVRGCSKLFHRKERAA